MITPTALARSILSRAPRPIPSYGSPDWTALPKNDLRRVASVLVAAECWRDHCSPARVAQDLVERMDEEDRSILRRLRETSWGVGEALRANLPGWPSSPSHAELVRRRTGVAA